MGYPTTVDTGLAVPPIINYPGIESAAVAAAVPVPGAVYFAPVTILASPTITQMRTWFSGSPTGSVSMGIYDNTGANGGPGNLIGQTGANAAATGLFTKSLTANLPLSPGIYWLAFLDTVGDTLNTRSTPLNGMGANYRTTATNLTVLPATSGTIQDNAVLIQMYALVSGGFS